MVQYMIAIWAIWLTYIQPSFSAFDSRYKVTEVVPNDPEPEYSQAPAKYQALLGNLYAGQAEFPWLVDVKVPYLPQYDAVGNLLTGYHVLVTCRTISNYEKYLPTPVGTQITYYEGPGSMKISFATSYLHEMDRSKILFDTVDEDKKMVGARLAAYVVKHPECDKGRNYAADLAIVGLSRPIELMPPYIALVPIWHDIRFASIPDLNDWIPLTTKSVCWVAAWGRNYTNVPDAMTLDHKVKIRAYAYPDLSKCLAIWSLLCPDNTLADMDICKNNVPAVKPAGLICMYTRSPVGAVCDTNKGAPVVCYEQVFGMVTRAVPLDHCNSTNPQPFVVVNLHRLETGAPQALYSGTLLTKNKQGAAPHFDNENIILYTRNGCPKIMSVVINVFMTFCLLKMTIL